MFNKSKPVSVVINKEKCTKCEECVNICAGEFLTMKNDTILAKEDSMLGCIQCAHCMMTCPHDAIEIKGEGISQEDIVELEDSGINFEKFYSFLLKRRSTRKFKNEEIPQEKLEKIIKAAATSAISLPPHEVKAIIISGEEKMNEFRKDILSSFTKMHKKSWMLKIFKPFMAKETYKMFNEFVMPLIKEILCSLAKNKDVLTYNANTIILFLAPKFMENEDSVIAATTATLAAESLNLGTCIIGSIPPAINLDNELRKKYKIDKKENVTNAIIVGYPDHKFLKGVNRKFKDVKFIN